MEFIECRGTLSKLGYLQHGAHLIVVFAHVSQTTRQNLEQWNLNLPARGSVCYRDCAPMRTFLQERLLPPVPSPAQPTLCQRSSCNPIPSDTMPKFDLSTPKGMGPFNGFISSKSYVEGYAYSQVGGTNRVYLRDTARGGRRSVAVDSAKGWGRERRYCCSVH